MAHRKGQNNLFPEKTPGGTRYDLTPGGPRRTRRLPPPISLFQVQGAPRLVCIVWGDVRLYIAEFSQTGRSRVTEVTVLDVIPVGDQVTLNIKGDPVKVPAPGRRGNGTWGHATLRPLVVANFDIEHDARGTVVSIQPKG